MPLAIEEERATEGWKWEEKLNHKEWWEERRGEIGGAIKTRREELTGESRDRSRKGMVRRRGSQTEGIRR